MKTKTDNRSIHQRVEHSMRNPIMVLSVVGFMGFALIKLDGRFNGAVHQAYAQGFGIVGTYMREETARMPVDFGAHNRTTSVSGY